MAVYRDDVQLIMWPF